MKAARILYDLARIAAALILLQTLYFKFTAAPESVYIFSTLGVEPWGRIGSGIVELVAAVMLLYRPLSGYGALLSGGTMLGAVASHLAVIGIEVMHDGGTLFALALTVLACSIYVAVWSYRNNRLNLFGL